MQIISTGASTHTGLVRTRNEDSHAALLPNGSGLAPGVAALLIVADGLGGHVAGDVASATAVEALKDQFSKSGPAAGPAGQEARLKWSFEVANKMVLHAAKELGTSGMATTLTALLIHGRTAIIANIGDSRAYLLREGNLQQLTSDHNLAQEWERAGTLTAEEAERRPNHHVLTRALGTGPTVDAGIRSIDLFPNDRLLLCTDGIHNMLDDTTIAELLGADAAQVAAGALVNAANESGGKDNSTAITAIVLPAGRMPDQK